jgi:hypothetical protein
MAAISEEMLMAVIDGEADTVTRSRVERAIAAEPRLQDQIKTQQQVKALLGRHYGPIAAEAVPDRFRTILGNNVIDFGAARERPKRPLWQNFASMAATFLAGFLGSQLLQPEGGPVALEQGRMIARAPLSRVLDTQLASQQGPDAPVQIGVTFAAADGRICRTFDGAGMAALACRAGTEWDLVVTTIGSAGRSGQYRQAGIGGAAVMEAAQQMMAGEPFDAEAERRVRDENWKDSNAGR